MKKLTIMFMKKKFNFKQLFCIHEYEIDKWFSCCDNYSELATVNISYKCNKCGKIDNFNLYSEFAHEWITVMEDYKRI